MNEDAAKNSIVGYILTETYIYTVIALSWTISKNTMVYDPIALDGKRYVTVGQQGVPHSLTPRAGGGRWGGGVGTGPSSVRTMQSF